MNGGTMSDAMPSVIVAGWIRVAEDRVDDFVRASLPAVEAARRTAGCLDFVVAADPVDPGRVNVFEGWASDEALAAFRGDGPGDDLSALILEADVQRFHVSAPASEDSS